MLKVESFSSLENTEVKVSTIQVMKDYMQKRICFKEIHFHTAYIGSSNFSRLCFNGWFRMEFKSNY
jgi:HKD family nuclease